jgi:hypothetical protein
VQKPKNSYTTKTAKVYMESYFGGTIDDTDMTDFMRKWCNLTNPSVGGNTVHHKAVIDSMLEEAGIALRESVDEFLTLLLSRSDNPQAVTPDCPPSPNDPSIVSLATKVGAPVAVVSTAVWLFLRSRAKKCTAVTTAALGLTAAIMTQFEGSASGSDQLDEEEINRVTNEIIEKECAGVLPRSCQEGGSQPPGGETEPPSGGGGGVTGGDGIL